MSYIAYFDGACEPINPGGTASHGAMIYEDGEKVWECAEVYGQGVGMSNNVAEYAALIAVLEWFTERKLFDAEVIVRGDSQLVINQMFGTWKIKGGLYIDVARRARALLKRFTKIRGEWIPRELNHLADRLSKAPLKSVGVKSHRTVPPKANTNAGLYGLIAAQRDDMCRDKRDSLNRKPLNFRSKRAR